MALHMAAYYGRADCLRLILDAAAELDADADAATRAFSARAIPPLGPRRGAVVGGAFAAGAWGEGAAAGGVLENAGGVRVDVGMGGDSGHTALYLASQRGHLACLRLLTDQSSRRAAHNGPAMVCPRLPKPVLPGALVPSLTGHTPLGVAVEHGRAEAVEFLLDQVLLALDHQRRADGGHLSNEEAAISGVVVDPQLLHLAVGRGDVATARVLLQAKPSRNARARGGAAASSGRGGGEGGSGGAHGGLCPLFDPDTPRPSDGATPLFVAAALGTRRLDGGGDHIHALGGLGGLSVEAARLELVASLIEAGANPAATLELGHTPLHAAAQVGEERGSCLCLRTGRAC